MSRILTTIIAVLIAFGTTSCSRKTKSSSIGTNAATGTGTVTDTRPDSLIAYLERTPCFGRCPNYSITVYISGYSIYEGKRDVDRIGRYFTWLSKEEVKQIGKKAEEIGFFDLNDEYRNPKLTDFPTVYVEVRHKGKVKRITHYDASPPPALTEMEDYIDLIFKNRQWQRHPVQAGSE